MDGMICLGLVICKEGQDMSMTGRMHRPTLMERDPELIQEIPKEGWPRRLQRDAVGLRI